MTDKKYLYEKMPVGKAIISLAIPTVIGQLITVIYNMADTFFVGQLNDPAQVAAATVSMPPFFLLSGIANLFGVGGASLVSRCLGDGNREKARRTAAFSIWTAVAVALVYGLLFLVLKPYILPLIGTTASTYEHSFNYLFWTITVGAVPTVLNACLAHLVRAEGMSRHAAVGVAMGGVLNIGLDALFIFVFRMEIVGAAMATALSNVLATVYYIILIHSRRKESVISFKPGLYTCKQGIPKEVCLVGLPNCVITLMGIVSNIVLNGLMSGAELSDAAVAGVGIAKKIDTLIFAVSIGMTQGVISLIAYNYASKNYTRMLKTIKTTFAYTMSMALCVMAFLLFCAAPVSWIFIADQKTVDYAQYFMRVLCLICPFQTISMIMITTFQAIGLKGKPLALSFARKGVVDIPVMLLLNTLVGVMGIVWAMPIAEAVACCVGVGLFLPTYRMLRRLKEQAASVPTPDK